MRPAWRPREVVIWRDVSMGHPAFIARSIPSLPEMVGVGAGPFEALADLLDGIGRLPALGCCRSEVTGTCGVCCTTFRVGEVYGGFFWTCPGCGSTLRSQCGGCEWWFPMPGWTCCAHCGAAPSASQSPAITTHALPMIPGDMR